MPQIAIRIFPDTSSLSQALSDHLADLTRTIAGQRGRVSLALAGGSTPRALYQVLAAKHAMTLPWDRIHLFWGDERYVPHDDAHSNYRMAYESLISQVNIPDSNVHPIPTHFADPDEAARNYEMALKQFFQSQPGFDLILLGMGGDGHTASLFPGTQATKEEVRWVVPGRAPVEPFQRVTVTMPVIRQAGAIYFLITGKDKAGMLKRAIEDPAAANEYATARVFASVPSKTICWTDAPAAANLSSAG